MKVEFIVRNGQEAAEAEKYGADRVELVSAISEGGLTPSHGAIKQVLASVDIPVYIMVRPHSRDFFYDETDIEIIIEDVKQIIALGGKHIVVGALNEDRTVNEEVLQAVIDAAPEADITFHRAIDESASVIDAYRTLTNYRDHVKSILTSGGADDCLLGKERLSELVKMEAALDGPKIMPGAGLNLNNIAEIHAAVGASQYHFGRAARIDESFANGFDQTTINKLVNILKK